MPDQHELGAVPLGESGQVVELDAEQDGVVHDGRPKLGGDDSAVSRRAGTGW